MKCSRNILAVMFILLLGGCNNPGDNRGGQLNLSAGEGEVAEISFMEYEYDFGKITEGEKVAHIFSFVNKGPGNLVISSVSTTCGCTVPKYNKSPIPPGAKGSVEVLFDSGGRSGIQTKTISVRSNSKTETVILKITADIVVTESD